MKYIKSYKMIESNLLYEEINFSLWGNLLFTTINPTNEDKVYFMSIGAHLVESIKDSKLDYVYYKIYDEEGDTYAEINCLPDSYYLVRFDFRPIKYYTCFKCDTLEGLKQCIKEYT